MDIVVRRGLAMSSRFRVTEVVHRRAVDRVMSEGRSGAGGRGICLARMGDLHRQRGGPVAKERKMAGEG
jgi:hypothetical protein